MSSRVARKTSLKLVSCGRPQLNKFDGKGFGGVEREGIDTKKH